MAKLTSVLLVLSLVVITGAMVIAAGPIYEAVAVVATPAAVAVAVVVVLSLAGSGGAFAWGLLQVGGKKRWEKETIKAEARYQNARAMKLEAESRLTDRQANFEAITAPAGHQVIGVHFGGSQTVAKQFHLSAAPHVNGLPENPTPMQVALWERWHVLHAPKSAGALPAPAAAPAAGPSLPPLIDVMIELPRILLIGGTGAGKTNTLKHYVARLAAGGEKITVIDPHSPSRLVGLDVIGAGLNFDQIADKLIEIMTTVSTRYNTGQISQSGNLPGLNEYLIIEEFLDIHRHLGDLAVEFLECMLIQARKTGFRFCLVSQNDSVDALGLKGNSGLLKGADRVEVIKDITTKERRALVGWKKSELVECEPPPLFVDFPRVPAGQLVIDSSRQYTEKERDILRALRQDPAASKADIYRAAGISKNGPNSALIDELRESLGVQA